MPIRDPDQISNFIHQPFNLKDLKKQSSQL
jgi:hypothetical protein